jgi:hypothetical protein
MPVGVASFPRPAAGARGRSVLRSKYSIFRKLWGYVVYMFVIIRLADRNSDSSRLARVPDHVAPTRSDAVGVVPNDDEI